MKRKILLIEPNYKNKFPPIALMKLSTYFKLRGDDVVFYKGDLKDFVIREITEECIEKLNDIDSSINWKLKIDPSMPSCYILGWNITRDISTPRNIKSIPSGTGWE